MSDIIPIHNIQSKILFIRNQYVMIDYDLADLYGVETKRLNEQVKRNFCKFPPHFRFQLTDIEKNEVVAKCDHLYNLKFSKKIPFAFTEFGIHGNNGYASHAAADLPVLSRNLLEFPERDGDLIIFNDNPSSTKNGNK